MNEDTDKIIPLRHYGRWLSGTIAVILLALVVKAFAEGEIDWPVVGQYFFAPVLLKGLGNTLLITILSIVMGLALGVMFAVMRLSKNPVTSIVADVYIWLFRGTPVYLQLLIWFNLALVFPTVNLGFYHGRMVDVMTPFLAALLGLGINEGAYMTEIVRGGILSVDRGQMEAASSIGMTRLMAMRRIVLPQAMRVIVPPIGNEFIGLLKTSSMASTIAFTELLHRGQLIYFVNGKVIELLFVAAGWYMIIVTLFTLIQARVEKRFARGQSHEEPPAFLERLWRNLSMGRRGTKPSDGKAPKGVGR
ncbi:MAG TPA: amino acid ABC transporter permease [Holophaga sp.]|nr:amino acid ABC transporter permease [Holophaga sp.]